MDTVTITKEEYEELVDDQQMLRALESAGVDNWEAYDYAQEIYLRQKQKNDRNKKPSPGN